MNEAEWNAWCRLIAERVGKIEKTLASYQKMQKRMLYTILAAFTAVIGFDLLLFYL